MPMTLDIDSYSREAEKFVSALDREYYLHFAGHKESFDIESIYERHARLFERPVVDRLRELVENASGDEQRRLRFLLQLAVEGLIGQATKSQAARLAEREATLEIAIDGRTESYRQAAIVESNEPDSDRRFQIEQARLAVLVEALDPLHREVLERSHELARELGWPSYRAMYSELKAIDLEALERQTRAFSEATESRYRELAEPQLLRETGIGFDRLRRSDLPYFFRAKTYDGLFPESALTETFERSLAGLGIDLEAQPNVRLDLEQRPRKSPRAFCAPVHVPQEIYLVIPRRGGRDDYAALFHEGGHTEHYASVDAELPFEFRHLGDNSVTEAFAFLLEHLVEDRDWLRLVLGADEVEDYLEYTRTSKLIFLRRYAAKLAYELELHDGRRPPSEMPERYAELLGAAVGIEWPAETYLADVDEGYYCANYLRAWALEAQLRRHLRERFGDTWFREAEAGQLLRSAWREGQRLSADELLGQLTGERLDFGVMVDEIFPRNV
jgi:oligoendopeptidase F